MTLTRREVEHIAQLARLTLAEKEKSCFANQLSAVLEHAARLEELDTSDIPPTATVLPQHTILRPDHPRPPVPRDDILANAPAIEEDCFSVPAVGSSEPES